MSKVPPEENKKSWGNKTEMSLAGQDLCLGLELQRGCSLPEVS